MANFVLFCDDRSCSNINADKIYCIHTYYNLTSEFDRANGRTRITIAIHLGDGNVYKFDSMPYMTDLKRVENYYNVIPKNISFLLHNILSGNEKMVFMNDVVEEAILNCSKIFNAQDPIKKAFDLENSNLVLSAKDIADYKPSRKTKEKKETKK